MPTSDRTQTSSPEPQPEFAHGRRGIVVGADGSPSASSAARWAADEAHRRQLPLTIVHSLHLPDAIAAPYEPEDYGQRLRGEGRALLARTAANVSALYPDVSIATELSVLSPVHALEAAGRTAETVVTGTRGHGGFTGMLLGSVTRALAAHLSCPLIVVPREAAKNTANEVVLGVGPRHSAEAARYAFEAAHRLGASLTVVRVWWPVPVTAGIAASGGMYAPDPQVFREIAEGDAQSAIKPLRDEYPAIEVHVDLPEGNAVERLLGAAQRARLLVVGARRRHGPLAVGAGYVVDGVIAHSPVPVAVVPAHA